MNRFSKWNVASTLARIAIILFLGAGLFVTREILRLKARQRRERSRVVIPAPEPTVHYVSPAPAVVHVEERVEEEPEELRIEEPLVEMAPANPPEETERSKPPFQFTWLLSVSSIVFVAMVAWELGFWGLHRFPTEPRWSMPGADPTRGKDAMIRHGCGACHVIPGIRGASGRVGPQLVDFANQIYVGGMLANVPENLVRWIQVPQEVNPGTAMPNLGVTEAEARDMAAYLYAETSGRRRARSPAAGDALPAQSASRR